jgi:hypothetical protein
MQVAGGQTLDCIHTRDVANVDSLAARLTNGGSCYMLNVGVGVQPQPLRAISKRIGID